MFLLYLFLSYSNLVTLDLPSEIYLFQVFIFDFLWEVNLTAH